MVEGEYTRKESTGRPCCKQAQAEVLASAITLLDNVIFAESLLCYKTSGMEILQAVRKNLHSLQPAAKDLEELLRKEQLEAAKRLLVNAGRLSSYEMFKTQLRLDIAELEKARAILDKP